MNKTLSALAFGIVAAFALAAPAFAQERHIISWSGQVDDTVIVHIHRDHVWTTTRHGADPTNVTSNVLDPLPETPCHVWLDQIHGRGSIRVVEEPSVDNNYTAVIRLKDPQNGSGYYSFVLRWRHDGGGGDNDNPGDGGNQ